jgi:hypothetical protein
LKNSQNFLAFKIVYNIGLFISLDGSPVMDMLRDGTRSGQSSPTQRERRPSSRTSAGAQNGRGGR